MRILQKKCHLFHSVPIRFSGNSPAALDFMLEKPSQTSIRQAADFDNSVTFAYKTYPFCPAIYSIRPNLITPLNAVAINPCSNFPSSAVALVPWPPTILRCLRRPFDPPFLGLQFPFMILPLQLVRLRQGRRYKWEITRS